ncbi:MAG: hydantoinase/oxoprolinase family protein [Burkholderiales bacterium]
MRRAPVHAIICAMRHFVLGTDIGGTFTDFVGSIEGEDRLFVHKLLTTHDDPTAAVFSGLDLFETDFGIRPHDRLTVVHATTLATNLILERKGANVALVTTRGFRDVLTMRRESRYDDYDLELAFPEPLVPRALRFEVTERTLASGDIMQSPDELELSDIARAIAAQRTEAVAVCLLHAYANGENERRIADALQQAGCRVPISLSSVVSPEIREYERCSTTVLNAYVQPSVRSYVARFESRLAQKPYRTQLFIMQSSGGYADAKLSGEVPARLVESGPAAGAIAAGHFSRQTQSRRTIAFDMGGTTAKVTTIRNFTPEIAPELEVARVHRLKKGSGMPLRSPSVELIEIGSGGGSIAYLDSLRRLRVGPESAGSMSGPACYDRGGIAPTVTDADLVLGYLDAASFPFRLAPDKARDAIKRSIADSLGLETIAAASGIVEVVTEHMASATRIQLLEKGLDARDFTLIAFGGAGPVHACFMARRLGIRCIIYPIAAGVASALGLLVAPNTSTATRTFIQRLDMLDAQKLECVVRELQNETARRIHVEQSPRDWNHERDALQPEYALFLDMRYAKQGYEISVPIPEPAVQGLAPARIAQRFNEEYRRVFGRVVEGVQVEITSVRLFARSRPFATVSQHAPLQSAATEREPRRRSIYLKERGGFAECDVLSRGALRERGRVSGPLVVEDRETTIVIDSNANARADEFGNVVAELA